MKHISHVRSEATIVVALTRPATLAEGQSRVLSRAAKVEALKAHMVDSGSNTQCIGAIKAVNKDSEGYFAVIAGQHVTTV